MKEDQEFDLQIKPTMNIITPSWNLNVGQMPRCSKPKNHLDSHVTYSQEVNHVTQMKRHSIYTVKDTYKKTNSIQILFQKLLCDHCSADSYKSMGTELAKIRFYLPHSDRLMKECPDDQLLQGK